MPSSFTLLATLMMMAAILPATLTRRREGLVAFRFVSGFSQGQLRQPPRHALPRPSYLLDSFAARDTRSAGCGLGRPAAFQSRGPRTTTAIAVRRLSFSSPFGGSDGSAVRSPSALFMGRRSHGSKRNATKYPPRILTAPQNGETPEVAMVYPERYRALLNEKVSSMEQMMAESIANATTNSGVVEQTRLPPTEVFESPKEGFRMRANFKMWRSGGGKTGREAPQDAGRDEERDAELREEGEEAVRVDYVMFERGDKTPLRVTKYPMGSSLLQALMEPLRTAIEADDELHRRINDVRFLTTLFGDALVTITYNRPIGDDWRVAAARLVQDLEQTVIGEHNSITLVGRSRKIKIVVQSGSAESEGGEGPPSRQDEATVGEGGDGPPSRQDEATVRETLTVPMVLGDQGEADAAREFHYVQTEGAFSQPNARVCQSMLGWAHAATAPGKGAGAGEDDLCELYCGNGCFTVVLASNFRRVAATEMSKASVELARRNLRANGVGNARVAKLNAEDFALAHEGGRSFRRLEEAGIRLPSSADPRGSEEGAEDKGEGLSPPPLEFDRLHTLFVDPPRAGLDDTCRALAAQFRRVVYVSCNPETLARDVAALAASHDVTRLAAFDQFPYTPHLEAGVVLERKKS